MKRLLLALLLLTLLPSLARANSSARGWCEVGAQGVTTSGLVSTTLVQASYPSCVISVVIHGGGTATIYSDNSGTPLSNPFTSTVTGQWSFFAANGHYDITLTGGGLVSPVTYSDVILLDLQGSGAVIANTQVAFGSGANTIAGSNNFTWDNTAKSLTVSTTGANSGAIYGLTAGVTTNLAAIVGSCQQLANNFCEGGQFTASDSGAGPIGSIVGIAAVPSHLAAGTLATMTGIDATPIVAGGGGAITTSRGIHVGGVSFPVGTSPTTHDGIIVDDQCSGSFPATNCTGIRVALQSNGKTGIGAGNINGYIFVDGTSYAKTAAGINAALLACTTAGGSTVFLPRGTINLTAVLTWTGNACDLVGAGRNNTILHMVDATNNINAIVPSTMSRIAHLTLTGTGAAGNANGITGALSAVTVEDCDISGFGGYGINSGIGSSNWNISRNYIHNNLQAGVLYSQSTNGIIQGNQIYSNTKNGIDIGGTSFTTIEGNSIYSNGGSGIPAIDQDGINDYSATAIGASSHNAIIGNDIHDNNTHGIRLQAGAGGQILYDLVVGNNIHNNGNGSGGTKGGAGIILRNDGGNGQIVGNTITGNTTSGALGTGAGSCNGDGICLLSSGGAGAFNSNTISGNTSNGNGNYGLELINSNIVDTVVSGNTLTNNTTNPYTDTSARSAWGCNHTQVTTGGCEVNGSLIIYGSTSGSITHAAPAIAGANTITDPALTGITALTVENVASRQQQIIADQGAPCTNGELALSVGWQSTGSATVTAVAGTGQTCSWTITTGTTTAANPTITDTLTNALPTATTVCWMNIYGGTHVAVAGESLRQTTLSATAPVFTANFTPTNTGATYFVTRVCGP